MEGIQKCSVWVWSSTWWVSTNQLLLPVQKHLMSTHYRNLLSTIPPANISSSSFFHLLPMHLNTYWPHHTRFLWPLFAPFSHYQMSKGTSPRLYRWCGDFQNLGYAKAKTQLSSHHLMNVTLLVISNYPKSYFNNEVQGEGAVLNGGEKKGLCL